TAPAASASRGGDGSATTMTAPATSRSSRMPAQSARGAGSKASGATPARENARKQAPLPVSGQSTASSKGRPPADPAASRRRITTLGGGSVMPALPFGPVLAFPTTRGGMRQTPRAKRRPCGQLAKEPISATLARNPGGDRREAAVAQDYQIAALWIGGPELSRTALPEILRGRGPR